jgi:hypothetical protein
MTTPTTPTARGMLAAEPPSTTPRLRRDLLAIEQEAAAAERERLRAITADILAFWRKCRDEGDVNAVYYVDAWASMLNNLADPEPDR